MIDILVLVLGLCLYAALPGFGRVIFTVVLSVIALTLYGCLFWIWLVFLDGMSWVQWFFGFAVVMSTLPAIACTTFLFNVTPKTTKSKKK